jgi:urea transport system ATP-binding protein
MFEVQGLSAAYGQSQVLHGVDFAVTPGEIVAVVGRNGMGKSTLMKSLIGTMPSKSGKVMVDGIDVAGMPSHQRVARGLAYVPQGRQIFGTMTVKENIETGRVVTGKGDVPLEIYSLFPILQEFAKRRGGNLSGGQQQQLAIARALVARPDVLLLDEPSLGLAPTVVERLFETLAEIRERGVSILLVEQRAQMTIAFVDRTHVIANGRLRLTLGPEDATDTDRLTEAYLS